MSTLGIGKDSDTVRKLKLLHNMRDVTSKRTKALHSLPTNSQHLVNGPNSLEVAMRRLPTVNTNAVIHGV